MIELGFAANLDNSGWANILNSTDTIMGVEDTLVNLSMEDDMTLEMIDRRITSQLGILEQQLEKFKGKIDFLWIDEDLGTQCRPLICTIGFCVRTIRNTLIWQRCIICPS